MFAQLQEATYTVKYGKSHNVVVEKTDCVMSHIFSQVVKSTKESDIVKPDEIAEVYPCSGTDICKVDQNTCGLTLSFYGIGKIACAVAPVEGEKVCEVEVVGVDTTGLDESAVQTQKGETNPDVVTVMLNTTVKAGCTGKTSGFCGSTLNFKSGIAITDAVKTALESKVGCAEHCVDCHGTRYAFSGKKLPLEQQSAENHVVSHIETSCAKFLLVKGKHAKLTLALLITGFGAKADFVAQCDPSVEQSSAIVRVK